MPIHLVPYLLSSQTSASLVHPHALLLIVSLTVLLVLRRWSNGKDLVARLYLRAKEEEEEEERRMREEERLGRGPPAAARGVRRGVRRRQAERDLHGLTLLVVCNFTPTSLLLLSSLSTRGAQLLLLLPTSSFAPGYLSSTMQYLQLLRDGTNNGLIYAEPCDMLHLASIDAFCTRWNEGEGGGGRAEGAMGIMDNARLSAEGAGGAGAAAGVASRPPRRCDGLILLPYTLRQLALSAVDNDTAGSARGPQSLSLCEREVLGRFHLINSLLSTLLLLPPGRDIRILNWVSPWYAAGVRRFEEGEKLIELSSTADKEEATVSPSHSRTSTSTRASMKGDKKAPDVPRTAASSLPSSPVQRTSVPPATIATSGSATLQFLLLLHELQRRLLLLAEADPRPRNPLPGILSTSGPLGNTASGGARISSVDEMIPGGAKGGKYPNVNTVNICPGFERDGEVWQYLWPSFSSSPSSSSFLTIPLVWLRRLAILLLWPLLGLVLAKSPKSAADQFLWGLVAPLDVRGGCDWIEGISASTSSELATMNEKDEDKGGKLSLVQKLPPPPPPPEEDETDWRGIQPARVYREGRIVNPLPFLSPHTLPKDPTPTYPLDCYTPQALTRRWDLWEERARCQREWEKQKAKKRA